MEYIRLEDEIDEMQEISNIRDHLQQLLCKGLVELTKSFDVSPAAEWRPSAEEPKDLIYPSLIRILATRRFNWYQSRSIDTIVRNAKTGSPVLPMEKLLTESEKILARFSSLNVKDQVESLLLPDSGSGREFQSRAPLLQCARFLQATVAGQAPVPTTGFLISYYEIIRELHDVSPPFYSMGAARARPGAPQTAFMTGECAKALNSVARAIESTVAQAQMISDFVRSLFEMLNNDNLPREWVSGQIKNQVIDLRISNFYEKQRAICNILGDEIESAAEGIAQELNKPDTDSHCRSATISAAVDFFKTLRQQLALAHKKFSDLYHTESKEICAFRNQILLSVKDEEKKLKDAWETSRLASDYVKWMASARNKRSFSLTSAIAYDSVKQAEDIINSIASLRDAVPEAIENCSYFPFDFLKALEEFQNTCSKLASGVRGFLPPSKTFLEAVLDRELAAEKGERINPTELVFAAAALLELDPDYVDERYERAVAIAMLWITGDGLLDSYSYLDTDDTGYSLVLLGSEVLKALAQILERVNTPLTAEMCRRISLYYQKHGVFNRSQPRSIVGWMHDFPRISSKAQRWTSALALLSLEFVTRAMSTQLNRRIQKHFMVTTPSSNERKLSSLTYTDYGLRLEPKALFEGNPEAQGESVAFFAQRLRAHVQGIDSKYLGFGYDDPCFSLILFGPPGTGKTNLIHTCANTAKVEVVEVTPSDIIVEGEAFAEKRAKLVFRALSMLTNVVILFDEFDSLLRRRKDEANPDVYSFITPGLLPKLVALYKSARDRRSGYALATNRVGTLDEAAIRRERFDYKIGVYPPDKSSRKGQIVSLLYKEQIEQKRTTLGHSENVKDTNVRVSGLLNQIDAIVEKISGLGIVRLIGKSNFGPWVKHDEDPRQNTIQNALRKSGTATDLDFGGLDDRPPKPDTVEVPIAKSEILQWERAIE